jgi:hypothetical protein
VLGVLVTTKAFDGAFELLNDFTTNQWNLWLASCGSNDSWKQANNNTKLQDLALFVHLNACKMYAFPKKKNAFCRARSNIIGQALEPILSKLDKENDEDTPQVSSLFWTTSSKIP